MISFSVLHLGSTRKGAGRALAAGVLALACLGTATGLGSALPARADVQQLPAGGASRPNILVVMLDDMRSDEMRFAPNARRYVRDRGLDFRNSFSPYPLCCPARASFLLGKYAHNHRVLSHEAPWGFGSLDDRLTVAGRLQQAGYRTALVGKYLNGYGRQRSRVTGRSSVHYVPAGWTDWMVGLQTRWPAGSPNRGGTYNYFAFTQNVNGRVVPHRGKYSSNVIGNQVRALIGKYHQADRPFFMWVTPVAPHHGGPHEPDDPARYREADGRVQHFETPARPGWVKGRFNRSVTHAPGQPVHGPAEADISDKPRIFRKRLETTAVEKRRLRNVARQRAESIYAWDVQFGKIVAKLKKTGEYANTVIVFTSDNGYYLGEHRQRTGKIRAHEPVLHVPLVVAGPGIARGARYQPITTMDLTSTVLDLAGAQPLPDMDGASKLPDMTGPDRPWTTAVITEGRVGGVRATAWSPLAGGLNTSGIRTGRYKLIRYASGESELYDLMKDPNELSSVWTDPAYATVRQQLVDLWNQDKLCRTQACRVPLPVSLQESPAWLAQQYAEARRQQLAYYGG